ncbi:MAG: hypothetical protein KGI29_02340 [Pseudomonadota bacterium]|nr:hypothetical protein [Pseudomonadota bacterium]
MPLPEKTYDRLHSLQKRWGLTQEDVYYAIENGLLRVCVWMPLRYMERGVFEDKKFLYIEYEHKEGFIRLRPEDFHHICSTGCAELRIFGSVRQKAHILRIAYEPPQPAVIVHIHDLVVLRQDQLEFEQAYGIAAARAICPKQEKIDQQEFSVSANYHHLTLNGEEYHLGDVQASIVQQLHDAYQSRNQWVHGKTLLSGAHSKALRLRDVFKSKSDWNKIVASNRRGYYRLNLHEQEAIAA